MKKTIDVSLAGLLFHLDEPAYHKLKKYLNAVRRTIPQNNEADEVLHEVEARIAELFLEKQQNPQQVINEKNVDEVISILGQPEDFEEEIDLENDTKYPQIKKALFKDPDRAMIAGVAAGLAHYLGMDVTLMRIIFVILLFVTHGTFILIYLLLWIIMPKAKTAADKLRMKGEQANLDNIVDQITAEDAIKKKVQIGETIESTGAQVGKILVKFIGLLIVISTGTLLIGILLTAVNASTFSGLNLMMHHTAMPQLFQIPIGMLSLLLFIVVGFPIAFIFLLGFKMLVPNANTLHKNTLIISGTIWLLSLVYLSSQLTHFFNIKNSRIDRQLTAIQWQPHKDTLKVQLLQSMIQQTNVIKTNAVKFHFEPSNDSLIHLKIWGASEGKTKKNAIKNVHQIKFAFEVDSLNNKISVAKQLYFPHNKWLHKHQLEVFIAIPPNQIVQIDPDIAQRSVAGEEYGPLLISFKDNKMTYIEQLPIVTLSDEFELDTDGVHLQFNNDGLQIIANDGNEQAEIKIDNNGVKVKTVDHADKNYSKQDSITNKKP